MRRIILMCVCAMLAGCGATEAGGEQDAGTDATCKNVFDVCAGQCGHAGEFCCWVPDAGPASFCLGTAKCMSDICVVATP